MTANKSHAQVSADDAHPPKVHATSHEAGGTDELEITSLATSETDDALVLAPDGAGGVEFRAESGGGGGATLDGRAVLVAVQGMNPASTDVAAPNANDAFVWPMLVPAPMLLDKVGFYVTTGNSGTLQWGLFDCSSDATACTKVAGGSGTLASTGYQTIAATGTPVSVDAGGYILLVKADSSNNPSLRRSGQGITIPYMKYASSAYTWDDTPNVTTGWTTDSVVVHVWLHGKLAAGSAW